MKSKNFSEETVLEKKRKICIFRNLRLFLFNISGNLAFIDMFSLIILNVSKTFYSVSRIDAHEPLFKNYNHNVSHQSHTAKGLNIVQSIRRMEKEEKKLPLEVSSWCTPLSLMKG